MVSVGLVSIQTAYLSGEIRRRLGGAHQTQELLLPGVTVCEIDQKLSGRARGAAEGWSDTIIPRDLLAELTMIDVPRPIHTPLTKTIFTT